MKRLFFFTLLAGCFPAFSQEVEVSSENEIIAVSQKRLAAEMEINLYPNPCNGLFFISAREGLTIEVFNYAGMRIFEGSALPSSQTFTIEGLTSGVYLCRVSEGENVVVKRVVVQ
jgi:hypothetical protein